jgi:hypothetical protein
VCRTTHRPRQGRTAMPSGLLSGAPSPVDCLPVESRATAPNAHAYSCRSVLYSLSLIFTPRPGSTPPLQEPRRPFEGPREQAVLEIFGFGLDSSPPSYSKHNTPKTQKSHPTGGLFLDLLS